MSKGFGAMPGNYRLINSILAGKAFNEVIHLSAGEFRSLPQSVKNFDHDLVVISKNKTPRLSHSGGSECKNLTEFTKAPTDVVVWVAPDF